MRRFLAALALCALLCPAAHAEAPQKYIALTFDDGPSGRCTERLLDGLAAREVHATFSSAATASSSTLRLPRASRRRGTRSAATATGTNSSHT